MSTQDINTWTNRTCPSCGGKETRTIQQGDFWQEECLACRMRGPIAQDHITARENWDYFADQLDTETDGLYDNRELIQREAWQGGRCKAWVHAIQLPDLPGKDTDWTRPWGAYPPPPISKHHKPATTQTRYLVFERPKGSRTWTLAMASTNTPITFYKKCLAEDWARAHKAEREQTPHGALGKVEWEILIDSVELPGEANAEISEGGTTGGEREDPRPF